MYALISNIPGLKKTYKEVITNSEYDDLLSEDQKFYSYHDDDECRYDFDTFDIEDDEGFDNDDEDYFKLL